MSSSLQRFKPSAAVPATTIPSLPNGNDAEVAEKLEQLVSAARNGFRVIITLGAFMTYIKDSLKHGEFDRWVAAYCPSLDRSTTWRWRKICAGVIHDAGVSRRSLGQLDRPLHEILTLPLESLTEAEAKIVQQIEVQAQSSSYKKLEKRPIRKKPELSPEAQVAAENHGHFKEWVALVTDVERMLSGDSLGKAIAHDPSISTRMEQVRIAWGEKLKIVTRAHKTGRN